MGSSLLLTLSPALPVIFDSTSFVGMIRSSFDALRADEEMPDTDFHVLPFSAIRCWQSG
jgi:hypothetical protein